MTYFSKAMFYGVNSDSRFDLLLVNILLKIEENFGITEKALPPPKSEVFCFNEEVNQICH